MPATLLKELFRAKAEITSKEKLFLRYYKKSGNAAWSAERAGYEDGTEGGRILEKPAVRGYLACQTVDRSAHRPLTYRDMIFLHARGMELMRKVWADPGATLRDKALAFEVAGRAVERVAKVEGLLKQDGMGMLSVTASGGGEGGGVGLKVSMVDMSRLSLAELEQYRDLMQKLAQEEGGDASATPEGEKIIDAEAVVAETAPAPAQASESESESGVEKEEEGEVGGNPGTGDQGGSAS